MGLLHTVLHILPKGVNVRLYSAICSVIEAWAERLHTDTLEREFDNADWAKEHAGCICEDDND